MSSILDRDAPGGAAVRGDGVEFRVSATMARRVELVLEGERLPMERVGDSTFARHVPGAGAGARYAYALDGGASLPDPLSRYQPEGPHEASAVVDPGFDWTDVGWSGVPPGRQIIYEMHIGTFTPQGTWRSAAAQLEELASLGVTAIELMPIAEFAGRFGWGYDGVQLFAPYHRYGTPRDARAFVDRAHALGMAVLLDVVYNHLGPDGNHLPAFIPQLFSERHVTDWGPCLNFDGPGCELVRRLVLSNVEYWIREFHFDGLRVDATQDVFDDSEPHILREIADTARAAGGPRRMLITGENEPQEARLLRSVELGGYGFDALWNDDFHHSTRVALTGRAEAYYSDYTGSAQELVSLASRGWLFQGQHYAWQGQPRGGPAPDVTPTQLIAYLQNHDQVANSVNGHRIDALTDASSRRALTAFLLLGSSHVLLLQGQEYAAPQPFLYFADHAGELGEQVAHGRHDFLQQFDSIAATERDVLDDPRAERTLARSTLDPAQRHAGRHAQWLALHQDLIALARDDDVLSAAVPQGAVLGGHAFLLRWQAPTGDRLLLVNLGRQVRRRSIAEPLIAPPRGMEWVLHWSSDDVRYGGPGIPPVATARGWHIPARAAVLLTPQRRAQLSEESKR